ncbi:MAG: hypothetical protein QG580_277 [Patescibacteria group bacterium]|jgi:predicted PurR-regulated permease PerM|nr:hypothetical protein [Patescibacteria group bacterium]
MDTKIHPKYFFFTLLILSGALAFFLYKPFLNVLILSASLSLVFSPVYKWLNSKMSWQNGWLASTFTILLFILILCIPLFFLGKSLFKETTSLYNSLTSTYDSNEILENLEMQISKFSPSGIDIDLKRRIADFISSISDNLGSFFNSTLNTVFSFFLMILSMFYFLKDGERWKKAIIFLSPLPDKYDDKIIGRLKRAVNGIIFGYLFIGFAQGALLGFGLFIFGVENAVLFGLIASIASLVPVFGTGLVAIPVILFLFASGDSSAAIGFLIWSGIVVGTSDEILRPFVIGHHLNIPPILILFSVLGGLSMFGPLGFLIGPLIISLLHALVSIYKEDGKVVKFD